MPRKWEFVIPQTTFWTYLAKEVVDYRYAGIDSIRHFDLGDMIVVGIATDMACGTSSQAYRVTGIRGWVATKGQNIGR